MLGYGLVKADGKTLSLVAMGVKKISSRIDGYQRLEIIHHFLKELIATHKPHSFAIEAPFFGKNVQSMLKLGRAQGVAIATAMSAAVPVFEYSPRKIKQSVTGNGNADKEQVWKMLQRILDLKETPALFDATDAVAVALCHYYQDQSPVKSVGSGKKEKGWAAFIKENPNRIS